MDHRSIIYVQFCFMKGRGGTCFTPVFKYMRTERKMRDTDLLIYFTDGYGDCSIPKPRTYRNLWVVLKDAKNLSLANPYGEVKALSGDKDWVKQHNGFGS